jgi:transforming growth factor-beta-induced protein
MGILPGRTVQVFRGMKKSTVTRADIIFIGGIIHVIYTVLTIPPA